MKKIMTLAAMFAAVMMAFSSCDKPAPTPGPDTDQPAETCPDCGEALEDCTCDELPAGAITIDGEYGDWDALGTKVVTATSNPDAPLKALKVMKAYADDLYLYVYFEYDTELVDMTDWLPVHFYINSDGDTATGGYSDHHLGADCDIMLEGGIYSAEGPVSYDASLFFWEGENGADGWDGWAGADPNESNNWGADIVGGMTSGAGADGKCEIAMLREMMAGVTFADTFYVGMDIQTNWESSGVLPNDAVSDENPNGRANKLAITIDK